MGRKERLRRERATLKAPADATPTLRHRQPSVLLASALVVLAGTVAYLNSFRGVFVFDDIPGIVENTTIRSLWPLSTVLSPPTGGTPVQGRPFANLTLAVNYALGGTNTFGYHLVNLVIHLLAGLTLLAIVRRTIADTKPARPIAGSAVGIATAVALIWTVHPLTTEAVTAMVQRTESLAGLLYLLTLYLSIRGAGSPTPARWYALAIVSCGLGMATKETMVSAPIMVFAYDTIFLSGSAREALRRWRGFYLGLALTWTVLFGILAVDRFSRGTSAGFGYGVTSWQYARTQCWAILHYLRLSLVPYPLVLDYGTGIARSAIEIVPGAIVVAALLAGTVFALARVRWLGFLGLWFFAILAPSSSFVPLVTQTVAEKRMYLPLAAVVTLVVVCGRLAWGHVTRPMLGPGDRAKPRWHLVLPALVTVIVITLTLMTRARNLDYQSAMRMWQDTVNKMPQNFRAHAELAVLLRRAGQLPAAIAEGTKAIDLNPALTDGYYNRGLAYESAKQPAKALADYSKAIEHDPTLAEAYNNRGKLYGTLGQYELALSDLSKAIELRPGDAEAYVNRGTVNSLLGRKPQAVADYTKALDITPSDPDVLRGRAVAAFGAGDLDLAWADAETCSRLGRPLDDRFIEALRRARAEHR
jgi:tetratricopeptide (TPR) repeat protein